MVIFLDLVVKGKERQPRYLTVLDDSSVSLCAGGWGCDKSFWGMITNDSFTQFLTVLIVGVALIVTLMSMQFLREEAWMWVDTTLVLLATIGMLLMVKGLDLIIIFLG
jgi:NADH:ubiquinone oxidoreductase subunit 2 (subunit N)